MAQYKVPQNVEAEDKILGPLSLRQFIYVIIGLMWGFLMWRIFSAAPIIAVIAALPVTGVMLALGLIQREEQSFENYFIAMIRFVVVPRKRIWHKDKIRNSLYDAPKPKPQPVMQRNPEQVRGQLEKLALIVDTRGRVPKSAALQLPDQANQASTLSARVNQPPAKQAPELAAAKISANDDILDMQNSQQASVIATMLEKAEQSARKEVIAKMQQAAKEPAAPVPAPQPPQPPTPTPAPQPQAASQPEAQNDILDLAMSGSSLSVAQIANQANRTAGHLIENQPVSLR